jgi:hypothetical protein
VPQPFELYHRASTTLRARRERNRKDLAVRLGREEGLALRAVTGPGERVAFSAASGGGEESLAWLAERVRRGHGAAGDEAARWDTRPGLLVDRDPPASFPDEDDLGGWLDRGIAELRLSAESAWIEVAATVETWVATDGCRASRTRSRAWACAQPAREGVPPLLVAGRGWGELSPAGWAELQADRTWPRGRPGRTPSGPTAVLFSPEASAVLVVGLARSFHADPSALGRPVGPAWRLEDKPLDEGALFGGLFDDARFVTARRELADGSEVVGLVTGPGHLRRHSFRDPPHPSPAHLVVPPRAGALPARGVLVSRLRLHSLGADDWVLECAGGVIERGEPGPRVEGTIRIPPGDLVRRCTATFGEPRESYRGVNTAALLFEGLPWTS